MSVVSNNILAGASGQGGGASSDDGIQRSIRLNSADSAYLSRSITNSTVFTYSCWIKRCGSGRDDILVSTAGSGFYMYFDPGGDIKINTNTAHIFTSNGKFRDPSAWYNIICSSDGSTFKLYINGVLDKSVSLATQLYTGDLLLGRGGGSNYADYYLADVQLIDGQALNSSSFGAPDSNGVWQPSVFSGNYGTNGFHLKFASNSTTAALGTDTSGNSNNFTVNNLSVAAGAGNDSLRDSPAQIESQTDSGAGGTMIGNYSTMNTLINPTGSTFSNGNLSVVTGSTFGTFVSTMAVSSGKWYAEMEVVSTSGYPICGIARTDTTFESDSYLGKFSGMYGYYGANGNKYNNNSSSSYSNTYGAGDVIGIAFDADNGIIAFYKNGVVQGNAYTNIPSGHYYFAGCEFNTSAGSQTWNFGQRPFTYQNAGTNRPSTDFKCLCSPNIPNPTIEDGSQYFDTALWTGTGATNTITSLQNEPGLLWIKSRNGSGYNHHITDSVRGPTKRLKSSANSSELTSTDQVTSYTSTGFVLGADTAGPGGYEVNQSGKTYVGWSWSGGSSTVSNTDGTITSNVKANPSAGFSVVTYTVGSSTAQTVGHGLNGAIPKLIIVKERNQANNWQVYHSSLGNGNYLWLNSSNAAAANVLWNSTSPTGSVFSIFSGGSAQFYDGKDHVAYCFAPVEGYSAMGSYTGNGSANGPFVFTGFKPAWLMVKCSSTNNSYTFWDINDSTRSDYNTQSNTLCADLSDSEDSSNIGTPYVDFLSNGFKIRTTGSAKNLSNENYIYAAFAEHPFRTARAR